MGSPGSDGFCSFRDPPSISPKKTPLFGGSFPFSGALLVSSSPSK